MNRDLDVVFYLSFVCRDLNIPFEWDAQLTVLRMLGENPTITVQELPVIIEPQYMPNTKQMVHMLSQHGFQPKFISKYLGIAPASVSVHLKTKPKTYTNKYLDFKRIEQNNERIERESL